MDLEAVVRAAQKGDEAAWADLVETFQDRVLAAALGWSGSWADAQDLAQEAFGVAFAHLGELREPGAFGPWVAQLVRTACSRSLRHKGPVPVVLDDAGEVGDHGRGDPAEQVVVKETEAAVRAAIEALPTGERVVVALFYLAGLSYPEIARFLGIGLSTTKKRGLSARRHLKELLPVTSEVLAHSRPSQTGELRDTVLLFSAIHRRDTAGVAKLVAVRPTLAQACEDWTPEEAAQAEIGFSRQATALIRAAETGVIDLAKVLVEAGAPVDGPCRCDGGETPLWAAVVAGLTEMVRYLLSVGADPNVAAFAGATPLHAAVARERHNMCALLLAAGADATRLDDKGRSPADWAQKRPTRQAEHDGEWLWTGIRVIDLFVPIQAGSLQWWPAALGLGQFVMVNALSSALAPAEFWYVGFEQQHFDANALRHGLEECGLAGRILLAPRALLQQRRRQLFGEALTRLQASDAARKVVVVLVDHGHAHDVEVILPALKSDPSILTTIVVEPHPSAHDQLGQDIPEGYDMQVAFDPRRARHRDVFLFPAIDPIRTSARRYPSVQHKRLVDRARSLLRDYDRTDPSLSLETEDGSQATRTAQRLIRYLAQHLDLATPFTSEPAETTCHTQLLRETSRLLEPAS